MTATKKLEERDGGEAGGEAGGDGEGGEVGGFRPENKFSGLAHKICLRAINSKIFANDPSDLDVICITEFSYHSSALLPVFRQHLHFPI